MSLSGCRLRPIVKETTFSKDDSSSLSVPLYPEKCGVPWRQKGKACGWGYGVSREGIKKSDLSSTVAIPNFASC